MSFLFIFNWGQQVSELMEKKMQLNISFNSLFLNHLQWIGNFNSIPLQNFCINAKEQWKFMIAWYE